MLARIDKEAALRVWGMVAGTEEEYLWNRLLTAVWTAFMEYYEEE